MVRHVATATIQWEFESDLSDLELRQVAIEHLSKMLPNARWKLIRIDNSKPKQRKSVIAEFTPEEVFPYVTDSKEGKRKEYKVGENLYSVRMNSKRYFVFKESPVCVSCGLKGEKFLLEQHPEDLSPHFNFYAVENGQLVLMTKDHVVPKSKGGKDKIDNFVTMCSICNNLKADYELHPQQVAELRKLRDSNLDLSRKELAKLIKSHRESLCNMS